MRTTPWTYVLVLSVVCAAAALQPASAHAQSGGGENPMGFVLAFGTVVPYGLALPVFLDDGHLPRPGLGAWRSAIGYQSGPSSVVMPASAGGYFGGAPWLGLEGRFASRVDSSTGIDLNLDAAELILLRPTPEGSPLWAELLLGASFETSFGSGRQPYITGGPTAGLRVGARSQLAPDIALVLEAELLYNARFSPSFVGAGHQLEGAASIGLMFDTNSDAPVGLAIEYRREATPSPEVTLPETHQLTIGAVLSF